MKTYEGWMQVGRMVNKGEKAEHYLVSPDATQSRPMFREDQTKASEAMDGVWTTVVPAAERPMKKLKDTRPKLKMSHDGDTLAVWCGPNKPAIAGMKKSGFVFDKYSHRWRAHRTAEQCEAAVRAYTDAGYNVQIGEPA